ncbi:phenylacetate--CoA ligase family protein [Streptomyces incarnatus]
MDQIADLVRDYRTSRQAARAVLTFSAASPSFWLKSRRVRSLAGAGEGCSSALATLLEYAAERCLFYRRELTASGHDVRNPPDLEHWPVLTKEKLHSVFADLIAWNPEDKTVGRGEVLLQRTSGSSGISSSHLEFYDEGLRDIRFLAEVLHGHRVPTRGEMLDLGLHRRGLPLVDLYMLPPLRYVSWNFSPFSATDEGDESGSFVAQAKAILKVARPDWLWGLPSRIAELASLAEREGVGLRPKVVLTSYEPLTDADRALISHTFNCPVVNVYGLAEIGLCGYECQAGTLHLSPDKVVAEVVDADGHRVAPGKSGRLLLTSLTSRFMPLVRYDTGDQAALRDPDVVCDCGSAAPGLARLEGRQTATIRSRSNDSRSAYSVLSILDRAGIGSYQVVQEEIGRLRLIVSAGKAVAAHHLDMIEREVSSYLEEPCEVVVESTGAFVLMPSGKKNPMVQMIPSASGTSSTGP